MRFDRQRWSESCFYGVPSSLLQQARLYGLCCMSTRGQTDPVVTTSIQAAGFLQIYSSGGMRICMYIYMCILPSKKNSREHEKKHIHNNVCRNHIVDKGLVLSSMLQLLPLWYREQLYCPLQLMRKEPGATSSKG
jgi:hypothetical protein